MIEILFIGRGGQGAKTASYLAAEAAFQAGKYVQAFPEFGPERAGAPVFAFTRIDEEPIKIHSAVTNPDIVVIIDETLLFEIDVCADIKPNGIVLVNTSKITGTHKSRLEGCKIYYVDATGIALNLFGKNIPNMPILGALSKIAGLFTLEQLEKAFVEDFSNKLSEELIKKNIKAMELSYEKVNGA